MVHQIEFPGMKTSDADLVTEISEFLCYFNGVMFHVHTESRHSVNYLKHMGALIKQDLSLVIPADKTT